MFSMKDLDAEMRRHWSQFCFRPRKRSSDKVHHELTSEEADTILGESCLKSWHGPLDGGEDVGTCYYSIIRLCMWLFKTKQCDPIRICWIPISSLRNCKMLFSSWRAKRMAKLKFLRMLELKGVSWTWVFGSGNLGSAKSQKDSTVLHRDCFLIC